MGKRGTGLMRREPTQEPGRPAVFLDRDGTLNMQIIREGKPYPPEHLRDFRLFPDIQENCRRLAKAGFVLVVATNQPDVGRGTQSVATVEAMHRHLRELVPEIMAVETCYDSGHGPPCRRRKPEPGMLLDAADRLNLDLSKSWMVGDRWRDIDCGRKAGVHTVLIDFGYAEELRTPPDFVVKSFAQATAIILASATGTS